MFPLCSTQHQKTYAATHVKTGGRGNREAENGALGGFKGAELVEMALTD